MRFSGVCVGSVSSLRTFLCLRNTFSTLCKMLPQSLRRAITPKLYRVSASA